MADQSKSKFYTNLTPPSYKKHLAYGGYVKSLSSKNSEGNFDILPMHENFLTIVNGPIVIVDENNKKFELNIENAIIEASNNFVKIFVDF